MNPTVAVLFRTHWIQYFQEKLNILTLESVVECLPELSVQMDMIVEDPQISGHLKMWIAVARHHFKRLKI